MNDIITESRVGNFSSSSIYHLMSDGKAKGSIGKPFYTYVEEKKWEIKLGRPLNKDTGGRPVLWGKFIEPRVFELIETKYQLVSEERYTHPDFPRWVGCPDLIAENVVSDIKAPYAIKEYCRKADIILSNNVEALKKEYPENFWQLVSNSILSGKPIAELIIYCPYLSELVEIKESVRMFDGDQNKFAWINWASDEELPYVLPDKYYKNLYKMEWEVSAEDKAALTERVKAAIKLLEE